MLNHFLFASILIYYALIPSADMFFIFQFSCDDCEKTYKYKKGLLEHIKLKHSNKVSQYHCPEYGAICGKTSTLKSHMKDKHDINEPYPEWYDRPISNTKKGKEISQFHIISVF